MTVSTDPLSGQGPWDSASRTVWVKEASLEGAKASDNAMCNVKIYPEMSDTSHRARTAQVLLAACFSLASTTLKRSLQQPLLNLSSFLPRRSNGTPVLQRWLRRATQQQ